MKNSNLIKSIIIFLIFSFASGIISPPDLISQVTLLVAMLIVFGILIFIISLFKSYKQTPESIKRLIIVMVCLLSVSTIYSLHFFYCFYHTNKEIIKLRAERSELVSQKNFKEEKLNY